MKVHEYQAKEIFKKYGIPTPREKVCKSVEEVIAASKEIGIPCVIKAQVMVGGRGKAGGIKLAKNEAEVKEHAEKILGMEIKGLPVKKVLVSQAIDIDKEAYLGIINDRTAKKTVVMVCKEGGVEIEEVARKNPEAIYKVYADPLVGLLPHKARQVGFFLYNEPKSAFACASITEKLYRMFIELDSSLAEINPLVLDKNGEMIALDAKINFDDNGLYRHPEIEAMRDRESEDENELLARERDLSYVKLSGNIGCVVNGAGLAMATMDLVKHFGGEPANFLDIGGSSSPEKVKNALEILLKDQNVKVIFFNIFGGITRCDDVANGILQAKKELNIQQPIVARLTGTNEEKAMEILKEAGLIFAQSMDEGAKKAIELLKR
ncbi:MAG TPA: ADP-forming succinate--CoA ligase subunit beta [candidate division WOR-3 bacterium]|uniref:Succinate--CoA ligase [ADP-forming] subunit beta n=1 Tax=candidate division WOR-3 bacterium TaxID=2052148 RepID=A0A9C9ELG8_UNCW3|nr:ADP-forming succinate--CoA ligase subunit beta [candidate division WOR-3 bacterium]